jgi:predicted RNA-binding Zn-ribbon protein involved in translation (DUF1610 family)
MQGSPLPKKQIRRLHKVGTMSFVCENCGARVPISAKTCPGCGRRFSSIRCPACGFTGEDDLFKDGCPVCGYLAANTVASKLKRHKNTSYTRTEDTGALPPWAYIITLALAAIIITLFFHII